MRRVNMFGRLVHISFNVFLFHCNSYYERTCSIVKDAMRCMINWCCGKMCGVQSARDLTRRVSTNFLAPHSLNSSTTFQHGRRYVSPTIQHPAFDSSIDFDDFPLPPVIAIFPSMRMCNVLGLSQLSCFGACSHLCESRLTAE